MIQSQECINLKRVTAEHVKSVIKNRTVDRLPNTTITIVTLELVNGAKAIGINYGTIDPKDQDWEYGRKAAEIQAMDKVWELENYLLRQTLYILDQVSTSLSNGEYPEMLTSSPLDKLV